MITVNELASKAATITHRVNKKACLDIVEDIALNNLSKPQLQSRCAELYSYFIPKPPAKAKTVEDWVWKAVAKKDIRWYLEQAYAHENGDLVATDGHRLHIFHNSGYEPGYYNAQMLPISIDARFPNYQAVVPSKGTPFKLSQLTLNTKKAKIGKKDHWYYEVEVDLPFKTQHFDKKYFDDAVNFFEDPTIFFGTHDKASIRIEHGNCTAVLMPMKK